MGVTVHIGPPKTATTSLQNSIIPHLGLPFEIRPAWTNALARSQVMDLPPRLDPDLIVSDEILGDFAMHPPCEIARRLAAVFSGGTILFCVRDPVEMFYSLYRQRLINEVAIQARMMAGQGLRLEPVTPAQFLADQWKDFQRNGTGFFALLDVERIRSCFEPHFAFRTLDFGLLADGSQAFAAAFAQSCGRPLARAMSRDNVTEQAKLENVLPLLPPEAPEGMADRYRLFFRMELNSELEEFITIGDARRYLPVAQSDLAARAAAQAAPPDMKPDART